MKKGIVISLLIMFIISYFTLAFAGEQNDTVFRKYTVKVFGTFGEGLLIRSEPDYRSEGRIYIPEGEEVQIDMTHYGYGHTIYDNAEGWIELQFTEITGEYEPTAKPDNNNDYGYYYVMNAPTGLKMRIDPAFSSSMVEIIPEHERLLVEGSYMSYGYVEYDGHQGWVYLNCLQPEEKYFQEIRVPEKGDMIDAYIGKSFSGVDPWERKMSISINSLNRETGKLIWTLHVDMGEVDPYSGPMSVDAEVVSYLDNTRLGSFSVYNIFNYFESGYDYYNYSGTIKLIDNSIEMVFFSGDCGSYSEEGGGAYAGVMYNWNCCCTLQEEPENIKPEQETVDDILNNTGAVAYFPKNLVGKWNGTTGVELTISEDGIVQWIRYSSIDGTVYSGYLGRVEGTALLFTKSYGHTSTNGEYHSLIEIPDEYLSNCALIYNLTVFGNDSFSAANVDPREYPYSFIRAE